MHWSGIIATIFAWSGLLVIGVLFFGKKWLGTRIEESVKHEYAKKVEEHKATLQEQINRSIEEMKIEFQDAVDEKTTDRILLNKFLSTLPSDGSIDFIRVITNNMDGSPVRREKLSQLNDFFNHWSKPEYRFLNEKIDQKRFVLYNHIAEFLSFIDLNTFPVKGLEEFFSVSEEWDWEDRDGLQEKKFLAVTIKLQNFAGLIVTAHEDFIQTARKSLKC